MEYTKAEDKGCGCSIGTGRSGNPFIIYCPLHKSAPKLYEALDDIIKAASFCHADAGLKIWIDKAKLALAEAEVK